MRGALNAPPAEGLLLQVLTFQGRKIIGLSPTTLWHGLVIALLDGARGEELRELSGLNKTEYESKRAKIRRRIEKVWS